MGHSRHQHSHLLSSNSSSKERRTGKTAWVYELHWACCDSTRQPSRHCCRPPAASYRPAQVRHGGVGLVGACACLPEAMDKQRHLRDCSSHVHAAGRSPLASFLPLAALRHPCNGHPTPTQQCLPSPTLPHLHRHLTTSYPARSVFHGGFPAVRRGQRLRADKLAPAALHPLGQQRLRPRALAAPRPGDDLPGVKRRGRVGGMLPSSHSRLLFLLRHQFM